MKVLLMALALTPLVSRGAQYQTEAPARAATSTLDDRLSVASDGQGAYVLPPSPSPAGTCELLNSGHALLCFDSGQWARTRLADPEAFQLVHSSGNVIAKVFTHHLDISIDALKDLALARVKSIDPGAHITQLQSALDTRRGVRMASLEYVASARDHDICYYERAYFDANGTVEIIGFTPSTLTSTARPILDRLFSGLWMVR